MHSSYSLLLKIHKMAPMYVDFLVSYLSHELIHACTFDTPKMWERLCFFILLQMKMYKLLAFKQDLLRKEDLPFLSVGQPPLSRLTVGLECYLRHRSRHFSQSSLIVKRLIK